MAHAVYTEEKVLECPWTVFVMTKFCFQIFVRDRAGEGLAEH